MRSSPCHSLAVLVSGRGSNLEALARASERGELGGRIVTVLCDRSDAPAVARAARLGLECVCLPVGRYRTRIEDERPWLEALQRRDVDTLLLAGFMRRLHSTLLGAYRDRILNIHPSLLPAFPGLDAIARAHSHGVGITGCTVHLVEDALDGGPIVAQAVVEILDGESLDRLEARVHEAEHQLYPAAVRRFLTEPWRREGRRLVFGDASRETASG